MIDLEVENGGQRYMEKVQAKMLGWIIYSTGSVAIEYAKEQARWVYATGYFERQTGGTEESIWARHPYRSKSATTWLIGPNSAHAKRGIGNLIAIWIPSARGYKAPGQHRGDKQIGPINVSPKDFVHDSWRSYKAGNRVEILFNKKMQEQINAFEQQNATSSL